jgi:hypothetical protein
MRKHAGDLYLSGVAFGAGTNATKLSLITTQSLTSIELIPRFDGILPFAARM